MPVYACFSTPCACIGFRVYRRAAAVILPGRVSGRDRGRSVTASVWWVTELTFDLAQLGKKKILKPVKPTPSWTKPIDGFLKINVDAGFIAEARERTTGLFIRDQSGGLMAAQALWYNDAASSLIMEAVAVRDGVQFVVDRHF